MTFKQIEPEREEREETKEEVKEFKRPLLRVEYDIYGQASFKSNDEPIKQIEPIKEVKPQDKQEVQEPVKEEPKSLETKLKPVQIRGKEILDEDEAYNSFIGWRFKRFLGFRVSKEQFEWLQSKGNISKFVRKLISKAISEEGL